MAQFTSTFLSNPNSYDFVNLLEDFFISDKITIDPLYQKALSVPPDQRLKYLDIKPKINFFHHYDGSYGAPVPYIKAIYDYVVALGNSRELMA